MDNTNVQSGTNAIEGLYREIHAYKTQLNFAQDEINFMYDQLRGYNFQPNTQNLFERLQIFEKRLVDGKLENAKLLLKLKHHENQIGGMLESEIKQVDFSFIKTHQILLDNLEKYLAFHHDLKLEIFNYISGFLKKRKPGN